MTQFKGQGSFWDLAALTERIMQMLEPRIQDMAETITQGTLDRQSIAWTNMQVLKHHEYRDQRERREHRQQRRFVSNQDVPDPTMPPDGSTNHLLLKVNELVVAVDRVLKEQRDLNDQYEWLADRLDQQLAYIHKCDAWLKNDEGEAEAMAEEEAVPDPYD